MVQNDQSVYGRSKKRLEAFFDEGTFVELGAYTKRPTAPAQLEGVVCGYGAIEGKLVFAFSQDIERNKGALDAGQARKIEGLYSLAVKNGAPVMGIFDSAGAVVYDGVSALASYAKLMRCVSDASGIVPQIAVIGGLCAGSAAVAASMFDFTVTVKNVSKLYVNSPFVVGNEAGSDDFALKNGASAYAADTEEDALSYVRRLVSLLPSNNSEGAFSSDVADDLNRTVDFDPDSYNAAELCTTLSDNGSFVRLYADYADTVVAGFASFGGVVAGILAGEPSKDGIIDIRAARVGAKLEAFCDSFGIPMVNLVNSRGLDVTLEAERDSYSSELARLAMTNASSANARVSVVIGKAYGAAFTLLASKSLGTDMVYALEGAAISVLSPEASVAFVWNDKVGKQSREELEAEWKEKCASAADACECGEVDDVIEASELRKRICAALSMLAYKAQKAPERRHSGLPL